MPIRKVSGGYKWGDSGKVYPTRKQAEKQAAAAYASGYKKYRHGGMAMQTCKGCTTRGNCLAAGKCLGKDKKNK